MIEIGPVVKKPVKRKLPGQRSLEWFRKQGWYAFSTSRWVQQAGRRIDFGGFADIIAYSPALGIIVACQTTTTDHQANRLSKILSLEAASGWMKAGGKIHVHGWSKRGPRGKRKLWTLTVTPVLTNPAL